MKKRIMICDDNREFATSLSQYCAQQDDFEVVGVAFDGVEACEMLSTCHPDYIILDIIMPRLDGLGVLERLRDIYKDKMPVVVVLSAVGQDKVTQRALELGAGYYAIKPFDIEIVLDRIRQLSETVSFGTKISKIRDVNTLGRNGSEDVEILITKIMLDLGFPAHINGYHFVRDAIKISVNDLSFINNVTKILYPLIAREYDTTASRVERSIRHAIEVAWGRGNTCTFDKIFGYSIDTGRGKPTNSEFIAMIADKLRLQLKSN